ncbi:MAG TPA: zinc-dependent metalloprotease, partial [Arenibacter sp.]|nr:zinc-dependent metalloprotease [Arenibacter sp.]
PFPDELLGELYQWMVAHEIGHTFGILDANFGEHSYPYEKMGDIHWLETMGFTPSVMNYTRSNNIAQPEDSIPPSLLIQKVGPIDRYNIHWAYIEFQEGISPEEEDAALEHIIRWQDSVPWYRYNSNFNGIGPTTIDEVVEARSPVRSTEMALKNIKRVIELLPEACRDEKDDARLERLYDETLKLWYHHMIYVTSVVGGFDIHYKSINQPGSRYTPISWKSQKEALDFLISNAINAPHWLVHPEFNSKIKYSIGQDRILEYQQKIILELLHSQRMKRIEYMETITGYEGALHTYMIKLREGLFRELKEGPGHVTPRSREIQLTFIDKLVWIMKEERKNIIMEKKTFDYTDYSKGQMMGQLMTLKKDIEKVVRRNKNENTLGHWKLCLNKLNKIL